MKATPVSFSTRNTDCITWLSSSSGNFDMKEAYKLARVEVEGNCNENFDEEWIWRVLTIPKVKNDVVFRNERSQCGLKQEVLAKATEFAYIDINGKQTINHRRIRVSWLKPPLHWHKLNSDAELWALRDGIRLCVSLKLPAVIFELDAKLIVDMLQKEDSSQNSIDALVSDCKSGLREIPIVQIQHYYREANKCTNALARRGALLPQDFVVFLDPPADVSLLLSLDSARMAYDHFVPSLVSVA
ncbi:uncharacterized protein LOC142633035 [Castanea sativa]|uniref:uncharacterized protein LOC142633035 n=1 Tax=Castanea sativa TaxID=21020 RepID=UPI003F653FF8